MKTLTHELYDQGGDPVPGKLSVAYSWDVLMQDGGVYSSTPKTYYAADGVFSVPILAADDPGIEPGYEAFTTRVSWCTISPDCNGRMAEGKVTTKTLQVVLADPEPVSIADLDNVTPATMGGVWYGGGVGGGGGVSDHGALTGLADDDHPQYHNNTRGDARYYTRAQVDSSLSTKANTSHTQAASTITDLTETVQDIVGAFIVGGTNVTVTYDDVANTFTINATASGGGSTDPEIVRDVIGAALVAGSGIQITVNDAADQITIASTAVLPTRQVIAGAGLSGGGDLSANRTFTVLYGTTAGTAAQGDDSRITGAAQKSANLSDLANAGTARSNLGLGTAATTPASAYATAAQGALADTALQVATAQPINAQTGTSYTLQASDAGKLVTLTNASAITLNAPGSVFTAGQRVDVVVLGAGMATVVGTSGATANGTPTLVSRAQYSAFTVVWLSATLAVVIGDLAAA